MSRVDEINEQIKRLEEERKKVMEQERASVLAKIKEDIKLFGFKTSDFKGVLATRKKRSLDSSTKKTTK
ncbi:MAG: H-NS histone family protein [Betaproteobacteria bacterium]|nr:H-NS histone family protein [Betaproteobacteria bacterium]